MGDTIPEGTIVPPSPIILIEKNTNINIEKLQFFGFPSQDFTVCFLYTFIAAPLQCEC